MRSFFILLWTLACLPVMAGLKLAPLFTDHLVLQQDTLVKVWGTALSGQTVTVSSSWLDSPISVKTDEHGHWCTLVRTLAADNLSHSIRVSCADEIVQLKDVVFGEVWFCSGQSNMEMKLKGYYGQAILTGPRSIMNARNDMLRICEVKKQYALEEQNTCNLTGWRVSVPEVAADCSAAAYFFWPPAPGILGNSCRSDNSSVGRGGYCSLYERKVNRKVFRIQDTSIQSGGKQGECFSDSPLQCDDSSLCRLWYEGSIVVSRRDEP